MAKRVRTKKNKVLISPQADNSVTPDDIKSTNRTHALSGWPMILAWVGMVIFTFHACTHMVAAGDTWVAMACGRHFVKHGVDTVEPFSANSHKPGPTPEEIKRWPKWAQWITDKVGLETVKRWHPTGWINQNWLTHVIFYWLSTTLGSEKNPYFNALVLWKVAVYILAVICVYYTGRVLGVHPTLSAVFACFTMFIGRSFFDVRPAGFSNLLVAVFLFILVLTTYRNILYIWFIVPLAVFWCNVHGGYIYEFIMLIPFIGLHLLTNCTKRWTAILYNVSAWPFFYFVASKGGPTLPTFLFLAMLVVMDIMLIFSKDRLVNIGWKGVYHTITAGIVAFFAMVLLNPFHLTNLTHTFVISASKHAERWRDIHEWHPAFEWDNPVGTAVPFLVMFILALVALATWAVIQIVTSSSFAQRKKRSAGNGEEYQRPRIDLPLTVIAALTIYMAIRSRRFIPVAAIAACPFIALFIDQIVSSISAARNLSRNNRLFVSPMPQNLRTFFILAGAAAVSFFGTWWGLKIKRVYLDAWPADPKLCSVFMRMTASDAKPFCAGKFIRDNKLKGIIFNYWTEGGFIAWAQQPDPRTGRTPLQLFMDGRAQAAYNREAFDVWTYVITGGLPGSVGYEIVQRARMKAGVMRKGVNEILTASDYTKIGQSISQELSNRNVWTALMPAAQFDSIFVRSLEHDPNQRLVLMNNKQRLFVDCNTDQGRELFEGIKSGKTIYPDDFSRNLILAHYYLVYERTVEAKKQGLDSAIKAFRLNPSPAPMLEIILVAARFAELKPDITAFCKGYFDEFRDNRSDWAKRHGYRLRSEAARLACLYLQKVAEDQRDRELVSFYAAERKKLLNERLRISEEKRW